MSTFFFAAISLLLAIALAIVWSRWRTSARADFIRTYMFPPGLLDKFALHRPELTLKERQLVAHALRQFFLAHLKSGRKFVSMPSQVADDLWHEFILYTRHYERFCHQAFGQFMHHTPAVVLGTNRQNNTGLRRTWWYCCLEEKTDVDSLADLLRLLRTNALSTALKIRFLAIICRTAPLAFASSGFVPPAVYLPCHSLRGPPCFSIPARA